MKFVVPWTGKQNTRIQPSGTPGTSSGVVGIGVVGIMIVGLGGVALDKDERWINCFLTDNGGRKVAMKRPGRAVLNTPASGSVGSAIRIWTGSGAGTSVITAFGATNSTIYSGTSSLGAITGKARSITETQIGAAPGTPTLIVPSSDNTLWYYDTGVGVMTKVTDSDYPGNNSLTTVGDCAVLNGFILQMTLDGRLWASDVNSVTSWTANSFDSDNVYPDQGVGCVQFRNLLMAFGKNSIEFWQNSGLTPFPLQRSANQTVKVGAVSSDAIATLSDNVFWCGSTDKGGLSIFQYDGTLSRISSPEIDNQLNLVGPSNVSLTTERYYGRSWVLVKANASTYVYCLEDKTWHEDSSTTPLWYKSAGLSAGAQILTYSISNVSTSGSVYIINPANLVFQDAGAAYTASIQSANDDQDSPYTKDWTYLAAMADIEPTTSTLNVYYSDDDYVTWTLAGTMDLSQAKQYLTALGSSPRQRAWKITHADNAAFRISRLMGEVKIGTT